MEKRVAVLGTNEKGAFVRNPTKSAFLLIDMEYGFLSPNSIHCIKGAMATIPACEKAIQIARRKQIPIFFIKRHYRADGSDVECTRYESWVKGGRSMRRVLGAHRSRRGFCPSRGIIRSSNPDTVPFSKPSWI